MTKIEWTDETWNPVTGCNKVSHGCKNCYAEVMHRRLMGMFPEKYTKPFLDGAEIHPEELDRPKEFGKKPKNVFVNSMSDLYHKDVPFEFIDQVFATMHIYHWHTFQILTKRADRMLEYHQLHRSRLWSVEGSSVLQDHLPNVMHGVSVEDQPTADDRIPNLLKVPGPHFLSCEPLLGPLDIIRFMPHDDYLYDNQTGWIDWVIAGGESGHHARPMHPQWVRDLREQCSMGAVPFFFKQWGEWAPDAEVIADMPPTNYRCPQCGHDSNGSFIHGMTHHTLPPSTVAEATKELRDVFFKRVGKSNSGNFLDGKQHLEFPAR